MSTKTRLSTYATLAAAGTGGVVGAADAAIISSSALDNTVINWNTGAGNVAATSTNILGAGGPGFRVNTRATAAGGGSTASGYIGVVIAAIGGGNVSFLRGGVGTNAIQLAGNGSKATTMNTAAGWSAFGNINLGKTSSNYGNPAFSGTSKYVMFRFNNAGTTNYGWIELKAATTGFSGGQSQYSVTLGAWAYDNTGAALGAGVTAGAVPGLGGLAALAAMGAAGVRTRRQR